MDPDKLDHEWHAERRRCDAQDIQEGSRTPEQVNQDNSWIRNARKYVPVNLIAATLALKGVL